MGIVILRDIKKKRKHQWGMQATVLHLSVTWLVSGESFLDGIGSKALVILECSNPFPKSRSTMIYASGYL